MYYRTMCTYVFVFIVLIQLKSNLTIRSCDHPWRKSLSLNGTVTDFLNDVKNILSGFLTIKIPAGDIHVEELKAILSKCSMNECWLYSMVDIKNQNSMSLCVVGNKSLNFLYCNIITCTCNKKVKRNIESPIYENNNSGGNKTHLKTASCEITYDEHVYWPLPFSKQRMTTLEAEKVSNKTKNNQYNTSLKEVSRDRQDSKDKDLPGHQEKTEKTWPFVLSFLIGVCFGILVGIMFTFLYLKRKGSKTNETKSVLNSIYFKRTGSSDDLGQLEVREYSEIPEHFKTSTLQEKRSQQTGEIEILEHSEANTCENDQCSSIIGECMKQDTKGDKPGRDFEDNVCLTQNVLQEKKNNQYHCIADISPVTQNYFSLESRKSKTPKQDTTSENHTDGEALYFILSKVKFHKSLFHSRRQIHTFPKYSQLKIHSCCLFLLQQQSISDIGKDCSETENEDRKIQQSNGAKKSGSSETEVLLKSSDYVHEKENLHVEP
uniref:Uncharacterized protein LOC111105840 isoform X5 n=1 Tax=Crassostrea virginica TaxID=6565 RepID=A0A8B8AXT0_CRAVI|nr:uncharacterized protein LOC111105840 isoform X5 [Crassostrea virginica]